MQYFKNSKMLFIIGFGTLCTTLNILNGEDDIIKTEIAFRKNSYGELMSQVFPNINIFWHIDNVLCTSKIFKKHWLFSLIYIKVIEKKYILH